MFNICFKYFLKKLVIYIKIKDQEVKSIWLQYSSLFLLFLIFDSSFSRTKWILDGLVKSVTTLGPMIFYPSIGDSYYFYFRERRYWLPRFTILERPFYRVKLSFFAIYVAFYMGLFDSYYLGELQHVLSTNFLGSNSRDCSFENWGDNAWIFFNLLVTDGIFAWFTSFLFDGSGKIPSRSSLALKSRLLT